MKKYRLVNPTIINGTTYWQVQALRTISKRIKFNQLGGWVNNETCLSQDGKCWIHENTIITDSIILDDVQIYANSVITDSILTGKILIGKNSLITNCKISSAYSYWLKIKPDTIAQDKTIKTNGQLDNRITNSSYYNCYVVEGLNVYCGQSFCKMGCFIISYRQAWEILSERTDVFIKNKNEQYYTTNKILKNLDYLKTICKQELNRLNIKIEEGD